VTLLSAYKISGMQCKGNIFKSVVEHRNRNCISCSASSPATAGLPCYYYILPKL